MPKNQIITVNVVLLVNDDGPYYEARLLYKSVPDPAGVTDHREIYGHGDTADASALMAFARFNEIPDKWDA